MTKLTTDLYIKSADKIEAAVSAFAETYIKPAEIKNFGVAVSGGADSVALFHLLLLLCKELKITPVVLHLNHGLRDASRDEADFVKELACSHNIQFTSKTLDLKNRPKENKSMEMAARDERIRFYEECTEALSLDAIATGHHADDVCETLLLRLSRGSGIAGLSGIRPISLLKQQGQHNQEIRILRPLLQISSEALRTWLKRRDLIWYDDLSNLDTCIPRNNVRHNIIPFLKENLNQEINASLSLTAETLREDEALLNQIATDKLNALRFNESLLIAALLHQPVAIQRRVLRLWLFEQELSGCTGFTVINQLISLCNNSGEIQITKDAIVQHKDELLSILRKQSSKELPIAELVPGSTLKWGTFEIKAELSTGINALSAGVAVFPTSCSLDAEKLYNRTLTVRQRKYGDRISPTGMKGSKKLKDILIDAKVPRKQRNSIPVITCGQEVLWIPGYRISRDYAVVSDSAQSIQITVSRIPW